MKALDQLRELLDPTVAKAPEEELLDVAKSLARPAPVVEPEPVVERPPSTDIVAKVDLDAEKAVLDRLYGAGAVRDGKRVVARLGQARVSYLPYQEQVAKSERGTLQVHAADARDVLDRLALTELAEDGEMQVETGGESG